MMNQYIKPTTVISNQRNQQWLTFASSHNYNTIDMQLMTICTRNQQQKRWILCVDCDEADIQPLAQHLDHARLLRVNGHRQPIAFEKITTTLMRGNCSTVIIWDKQFSKRQLNILRSCAKHGNTKCIIMESAKHTLH